MYAATRRVYLSHNSSIIFQIYLAKTWQIDGSSAALAIFLNIYFFPYNFKFIVLISLCFKK